MVDVSYPTSIYIYLLIFNEFYLELCTGWFKEKFMMESVENCCFDTHIKKIKNLDLNKRL